MKIRKVVLAISMATVALLSANAQISVTSKITNPSFESDFTGWTQSGFQTQSNTAFTKKSGNTYVEKWTAKGGAVGSASAVQTVKNLAVGSYTLTAAAQNIQEGSATAKQTGAKIVANGQETPVYTTDDYSVSFVVLDGTATIGFVAENATGNWIACDNFRLTLDSTAPEDVLPALQSYIDEAEGYLSKNMSDLAKAEVQKAVDNAKSLVASNSIEGITSIYNALVGAIENAEKAVWQYQLDNASRTNPLDVTSLVVNPSFEEGFDGWTNTKMQTQGNSAFGKKSGNTYVEKWVSKGTAVGTGSVMQTLKNVSNGVYILTASGQNIQEGSSVAQTGAYIVANNSRTAVTSANDYNVEVTVYTNQLNIGFSAYEATGNWISADNFRLNYVSSSFDDIKAGFKADVDYAKQLAERDMDATVLAALQTAVADAEECLDDTDDNQFAESGLALAAAIADAEASADEFDFAEKINNATGAKPTVVTDKRYARGSTMIFGRSTVTGSDIMEQGFCWSTDPEPTVLDNRTTEYIDGNGRIYWMKNLKPATKYYVRAYAMTSTYAVGYGEPIKVYTIPKGSIGWSYDFGGDDVVNERINNACETAYYYWENLIQIKGFYPSVHYSPGTPTADCSYGGWMRMGANASYQSAGTIMHESLHGVGVGTHNMWWSSDMRSNGDRGLWLGDRVNAVLRFWDNNTDGVLNGDNMHMWPYGINGAHEDNHTDHLYCVTSLIAEALGEDGLPLTNQTGVALPAYSFNQEDDIKYYIKNEDISKGLLTSFLVEDGNGNLVWKEMTSEDAQADNSNAAWYITFTPDNQYYQFRNAATGHYITYSASGANGIKTAAKAVPSANEDFHLMMGRIDVASGSGANKFTTRGYYIIHHDTSGNPPTLTAGNNGATGTSAFNIANTSTTQRWVILTADETEKLETASIDTQKTEYADFLKHLKALVAVPHTEDVEGTDETVNNTIEQLEQRNQTATTADEVAALVKDVKAAAMTFLANATPADINNPFDLTFLLNNPSIDDNSGWSEAPAFSFSCCEFYQTTYDFNQSVDGMPAGTYKFMGQAFQRPGDGTTVYNSYISGTDNVVARIYAGAKSAKISNIASCAQSSNIGGNETAVGSPVKYIPNNMEAASLYFAKGLYDNEVVTELSRDNSSLKVGLRCTTSADYYWTIFDNFRLYYYGSMNADTVTGIDDAAAVSKAGNASSDIIYNMQGVAVGKGTDSLNGLKPGIYIVGGRKVLVK